MCEPFKIAFLEVPFSDFYLHRTDKELSEILLIVKWKW